MESGVFLLGDDNQLVQMKESPYEAELLLQQLLEDHPALMAGDQINQASPREWLHLSREAGVPARQDGSDQWSLDHLFLDQDAIPTFVEVKRASDTRIRREVVAQMLDYAANATEHWPVQRMREMLAARCQSEGTVPAEQLANILGVEEDEESFWARADANLREGRIRLLFVADKIPSTLQRIVEFLNKQMTTTEVLAVEVRQFTSAGKQNIRTLVPRVIGQTEVTRKAKESRSAGPVNSRSSVTLEDFWSRVEPERRELMQSLVDLGTEAGLQVQDPRVYTNGYAITLNREGVSGKPISLSRHWFWVSLGRHHLALRAAPLNADLREAVLRFSPTTRSAADLRKTEVGIKLADINPDNLEHASEIFRLTFAGLGSDIGL